MLEGVAKHLLGLKLRTKEVELAKVSNANCKKTSFATMEAITKIMAMGALKS